MRHAKPARALSAGDAVGVLMPFAWDDCPRVIGHRGSPREATENTMASFRAAVAAGARAVELDARLSRDGVVVVHHDAELGRVVAGAGAIDALDAKVLCARGVPTLEEVLAIPGLLVDLELKADGANVEDLPARAYETVRDAGALDRVLATSFDPALADAYAALARRPAGAILPFVPEPEDLDAWPRLSWIALAEDACEPEALALARQKARRVLAWTVDDATSARRLLDAGVAGVITDRPGALLRSIPAAAPVE